MKQPLANMHGDILPLEEVRISVLDRGFLFGDAVYEVLRIYGGKGWLEKEHFQRLTNSLAAIRIEGVDIERLRQRMRQTIAAGGFAEGMAYLHVTRGAAPRRHAFPKGAVPLEFLFIQDYDDAPTAKLRAAGARVITYPDIRWGRCEIKSTNLLANVLANQASAESAACEALLYLSDGTMSEGSHSSFFTVRDDVLQTTPLKSNILPGITRNFVVGLARDAGIRVLEKPMHRAELYEMDEVFLTGTTSEILPIVQVDDKPIAAGNPGAMSKRLLALHQKAVRAFLSPLS